MRNHSSKIKALTVFALAAMLTAVVPFPHAITGFDGAAYAQSDTETETPRVPRPKPDPGEVVEAPETPIENLLDRPPEPLFSDALLPYAPSSSLAAELSSDPNSSVIHLMARLTRDSEPLPSGLVWRVYSETTNDDGRLELVTKSEGGNAEFRLGKGTYLIHTGYGYASAVNRVVLGNKIESKMVTLNAGGIKLNAALDQSSPIRSNVRFDIYGMEFDERGERELIVGDILPGKIVRLNAETYHIVSRYGDTNSVVRADVQVLPGKMTEATLYHNAAEITLKLVNDTGGEAIANTSWSVLNPGGDVVVEATGAFPSFVLATGEYEVIARNNGRLYRNTFNVETGANREVEVLAKTRSDKKPSTKVN